MEDPCDKTTNAADLVPGDMDFHLLHGRDLDTVCLSFQAAVPHKKCEKKDPFIETYGCFLKWWYPQNTPKMVMFSRKTNSCWVPPF